MGPVNETKLITGEILLTNMQVLISIRFWFHIYSDQFNFCALGHPEPMLNYVSLGLG